MTFIKDESNNKLNIVIANYFCCSKKTTISLQNISFFYDKKWRGSNLFPKER